MESLKEYARAYWSHNWPGLALGAFSALFLVILLALGEMLYFRPSFPDRWLVPLFPLLPGLMLLVFAGTAPTLFARTRTTFTVRAAKRILDLAALFSAIALGFYCGITAMAFLRAQANPAIPAAFSVPLLLAVLVPAFSKKLRSRFTVRLGRQTVSLVVVAAAVLFSAGCVLCFDISRNLSRNEWVPVTAAVLTLHVLYSAACSAVRPLEAGGRLTLPGMAAVALSCAASLGGLVYGSLAMLYI